VFARASWYESLTTQPRTARVELRACNNQEQAVREAIFRMQQTEMVTRHGSFRTGLEAMFLERGDVIEIVHPTNSYGFGGRLAIDHSATTTITLDQIINMPTADYDGEATMFLVDPDGERKELTITGPYDTDTQTVTVDSPYTGNRFDAWAIGRPNQERLLYQILDKRLVAASGETAERLEISFAEYVDARFYHADYGGGETAI
jgi:predicted phage tail protein